MRRMDQGTAIGLQATAIGVGIGAAIYTGHARAMEAVRANREAREQAAYHAAVAGNVARLEGIARAALRDLGEAQAEVERLRRALAQRQAFIDRQRRAA
ncbi:hypothetical protein [Mesorhizobium sp. 2RAF21]|uniref:hypothetical protein n=1 Tax=Mesorhizobium sp. 2RAF21 TaxID=3232995 RepID=UPI003F973E84